MPIQKKEAENQQEPLKQTSIIDMPLGGENPNPGFLTDKGEPYVTEGSKQATVDEESDANASQNKTNG